MADEEDNRNSVRPETSQERPRPQISSDKMIEMAQVQNDYVAQRFSTKNSLYNYKHEQLTMLNRFFNSFLALYYVLAGIYLATVFVDTTQDYSYYYKISLLLILISFPLVITPIENFLYDIVMYMYKFLFGVIAIND